MNWQRISKLKRFEQQEPYTSSNVSNWGKQYKVKKVPILKDANPDTMQAARYWFLAEVTYSFSSASSLLISFEAILFMHEHSLLHHINMYSRMPK